MYKIDIKAFNPRQITLPYFGKQLCQDAMSFAEPFLTTLDDKQLTRLSHELMENFVAHVSLVNDDIVDSIPFDPTNIFEFPSDMETLDKLQDDLALTSNQAADITKRLVHGSPDEQNILYALLLLFMVYSLQSYEEHLLASDKKTNFIYLVKTLEPSFMGIHSLLTVLKNIDPAIEILKSRLSKRAGGLRGAAAKNERFNDLKDLVLEKDQSLFAGRTAAASARELFRTLDKSLFLDSNGKPLSADPVTLLTTWIRADRRHRKSTSSS